MTGKVRGVRFSAVESNIKYADRLDLALIVFDSACPVAGVQTRSLCPGAPVSWNAPLLSKKDPVVRGIVINAGNANAFTGMAGDVAARETAEAAASAIGCSADEILLSSTGVIGEPLDTSFVSHFSNMVLDASADSWLDVSRAIMTTDTYPKHSEITVEIDDTPVTLLGVAKGSGMIAPDMATMLSFIVTDAAIDSSTLRSLLLEHTATTFNAITVDSDTSTSDMVLFASTGACSFALTPKNIQTFSGALRDLMSDLSLKIVRDGEGATKLVRIEVSGAVSIESARRVGFSIANSPLVKTAIAGEDANWGRIVMAVGKAGEPADRDNLTIWFGDICVARAGERSVDYDESEISALMKSDEILVRVDLGVGDSGFVVWTCDLTKEYVSINGDYRS